MKDGPRQSRGSASPAVPRVAFAAGGTAGHVHPALAVAEAYREIAPDAEIIFLGTASGLEGTLVPAAGYGLELLPGSAFFGRSTGGKLRSLCDAAAGMVAAARLFRSRGTQGLLSFGGYASAGAVLGARRAGVPVALCELNVASGLTNRLFGRLADRVFLACGEAAPAFPHTTTVVTGVPVRAALRGMWPQGRKPEPPWRILVLGGSLGSVFLNQRVPPLLARMQAAGLPLRVHHQTGADQEEPVRRRYARCGVEAAVSAFVEDIVRLYAWADFAITCAGAVTLAELVTVGLPALVIPLSVASEDHQAANAEAFSRLSGCPWVREGDWDEARLAGQLAGLLDTGALLGLARKLRHAARDDAAVAIARQFQALVAARSST